MGAHPNDALKAFVVNTEIAIDANIRGLNHTPNDARAMIAMRPRCCLTRFLIVMVNKVMAENNLWDIK